MLNTPAPLRRIHAVALLTLAGWGTVFAAPPDLPGATEFEAPPAIDAKDAVIRAEADMLKRGMADRYFVHQLSLNTRASVAHWEITLKSINPHLESQPVYQVFMDGRLELTPGR